MNLSSFETNCLSSLAKCICIDEVVVHFAMSPVCNTLSIFLRKANLSLTHLGKSGTVEGMLRPHSHYPS